jgi:hypothetical protein
LPFAAFHHGSSLLVTDAEEKIHPLIMIHFSVSVEGTVFML